jgi:tRNA dimethylallyltransferase
VRVVRALEIVFLTGRKASEVFNGHGFSTPRHDARVLCVMPDRDRLYHAIDSRVVSMVEAGLMEETRKLLDLGFDPGLRSMQTLAYKHALLHLEGSISLESAVGRIQRDTRHYAKRQLTWMRSHHDRSGFHAPGPALEILSAWLEEG